VPAQAATSATWYVAIGGRGTSCTVSAPCGSIGQAFSKASAGDTILVGTGTYPSQLIQATAASASFASNVVVKPVPGASPKLVGIVDYAPHLTIAGLSVDASAAGACADCGVYFGRSASSSQLIGSTLTNATVTLNANNSAVIGTQIGPSVNHDGIDVADGASGVLITRNFIHDLLVGYPNPQTVHVDCLQIYDSSNITVSQNRISNCTARALIFSPGQGWGVRNVTVTNNFIRGCVTQPCQGAGYVVDARDNPTVWSLTNFSFVSNTVVDGSTLIADNNPGEVIRDNIIGYLGNCMTTEDHNLIAAYNLGLCKQPSFINPTSRLAPLPQFANQSADDLHLTQAYPDLRFASPVGQPAADFDGVSRCQPSYVGAFDACAHGMIGPPVPVASVPPGAAAPTPAASAPGPSPAERQPLPPLLQPVAPEIHAVEKAVTPLKRAVPWLLLGAAALAVLVVVRVRRRRSRNGG
jgi:hypothetical protein